MSDLPLVTPSPVQRDWQELEIGMFFHFDIATYMPAGWHWRTSQTLPDPDLYRPTRLDTDQWMEAARAIGAKYAILVAKHGSGFLQWQSDLYPYGVRQSSWRAGGGDVVADFVASCHKYNIRPGLYASVATNAYFGVSNPGLVNNGRGGDDHRQHHYVQVCEQMMTELWTRYGELFEIWFDGGALPVAEGGPDLIPILRRHQPNAVVFQGPAGTPNTLRWIGNERGIAPYPCWSTTESGTAEAGIVEEVFAGDSDGQLWIPGECDVPIRNHEWFWRPNQEKNIYSLAELMEMYVCSVGRNCNLLLNANPGPDGLVPEADFRQYEAFGREVHRRFGTPIAATAGEGAEIVLDLRAPQTVDHAIIMEEIAGGERILEYVLEGRSADGVWQSLGTGQCVGHKRIEAFSACTVTALRLRVTGAKATPQIRSLEAYFAG